MSELPLVTVFTLIYNTSPSYVIEALQSVRANNYPNIQHIIIDDCSPDAYPKETVKQWIAENNYPCEFHEHEVNYGICKTLNHVLELAKGTYILGCSDDLLSEKRIPHDVALFESLPPDYAIVFGLSQIINDRGQKQFTVIPNVQQLPTDDRYFDRLITGNILSTPAVTMKTEALRSVGGYDENLRYEDYDMWLRLASSGYKFKPNPEINTFYRIHEAGFSQNVNFTIEDFKCLLKYSNLQSVKDLLRKRLIKEGFSNPKQYPAFLSLYTQKEPTDFALVIVGWNIHPKLKSILLKAYKLFSF